MSPGLALVFERPGFAPVLLCVPLLLWLARRAERPPDVPTGTLALWQDVQELHGRGARARQRVPGWAWFAAAALLGAGLALAGPRTQRRAPPALWTVVVDLSPSMHLPLQGVTRLARALERAEELLAETLTSDDRVRWVSPGRAALELAARARPGADWFALAGAFEPEPAWEEHDHAGTVWITDRLPAAPRAHAFLCASGGPAVGGAIAGDGARRVLVGADGRLVVEEAREAAGVALRGEVPAVLVRAARAWAEARGFALGSPADHCALLLEAAGTGAPVPVTLGANGWRAEGEVRGAGSGAAGEEDAWLAADASGRELVALRARPGRVRVYLRTLAEPAGDPAAFALACGRLFDAYARPREDVVPLEERGAAGEPQTLAGRAPGTQGEGGARGSELESALAGLAALLAGSACLALRSERARTGAR